MAVNHRPLVYGPAYLDIVLEIDRALAPDVILDQNVSVAKLAVNQDGEIIFSGPTDDRLQFPLPIEERVNAVTLSLAEPLLARRFGAGTQRVIRGRYAVFTVRKQLGGMGAGFAKALDGILRCPLGSDNTASFVLRALGEHGISAAPIILRGIASDTSYLILSPAGDKIAAGLRTAQASWSPSPEDERLLKAASLVVFCGAPNAHIAELLSFGVELPVICAPSSRNITDSSLPFCQLAKYFHYLSLNSLEWEQLDGKETCRREIPVITVTDGPGITRIFVQGEEIRLPAETVTGPINGNRAGETFASTFLKVLLDENPEFFRTREVAPSLALKAGQIATSQATRQLSLTGFDFPPDHWRWQQ